MGKTNKMNMARFDDFISDTKGRAKRIFFKLDQNVQRDAPVAIGDRLVQPPATYRAAIVLSATDEVNDKGEKNYWVHLYLTSNASISTKEDQDAWDVKMAEQLSKLKKDIQALAPGLGMVEGTVEVI